jgi:hypothetical protein
MFKQNWLKYDKQDQQGQAAFNERNLHTTEQQGAATRSPGGPHNCQNIDSCNCKSCDKFLKLLIMLIPERNNFCKQDSTT